MSDREIDYNPLNQILRRSRLAAVLAMLAMVVVVPVVLAHAKLVRSEPADNAILVESPPEVRLWFSEAIAPEFSSAQILDIHGRPVEVTGIRVEPAENLLILALPDLAAGLYSVRWRVLSEADGHFSRGLLVFGIGEGVDLSRVIVTEAETIIPAAEVLLRWLNFSVLLMLTGSVVVAYHVLNPAGASPGVEMLRRAAQSRALALAMVCSVLAIGVGVGLLLWQVMTLLDTLPVGVSPAGVGWQLLSQTRWGLLWLARQGILLILAGLIFLLYHKARGWRIENRGWKIEEPSSILHPLSSILYPLSSLLLLALLAVQALTSHAAALTPNTTLAVLIDTLHLLAAGLWMGGLAALIVGLLPLIRRDRADFLILIRSSWAPFSRLAALSVGLLIATGLYSAGRHVASVDAFLMTLYGQTLLVKIGLMLAMGAFGLLNALLLHPYLASPLARLLHRPSGWTPLSLRQLPVLVLTEVCLGFLILFVSGILTATPTAAGPEFKVSPEDIPTMLSQTVDDMLVTFSAKPNRPGQNVFTIRAVSTRRPPPAEIMRVILRFTFLGEDMGRTSADAVEIEPGLYQVGGSYLSLAGPWQVQVVVRRRGIEDGIAQFHWVVAPPGPARPVFLSKRSLEPILTIAAGAAGLILLVAGGAWLGRGRLANLWRVWHLRGRKATILLAILSLSFFLPDQAMVTPQVQAAPPTPGAATPNGGIEKIAPEVQAALRSLQAGQMLAVIVTLKDQADLRRLAGTPIFNRAARLRNVVETLRAKADLGQRSLKAWLASRQAQGQAGQVTYFWIFNGLAVTATPAVIQEMAARPEVLRISPNETIPAPPLPPSEQGEVGILGIEENLSLINAPALWDLGYKGQGVVVANMDTGVDVDHPQLGPKWRGGANSWYDPYNQHPTTPTDLAGGSSGHGTRTMGIMVGGKDNNGNDFGVAPEARWIAVKIFNDSGNGVTDKIHAGFQWLLDPDGNPATPDAPHVVNNSWTFANPNNCNLEFQADLLALRAAGILPIFAAGNAGPNASTSYSPANNPGALAVGAIDNNNIIYSGVSGNNGSSRGPRPASPSNCIDGTVFPDVVAPGVSIRTTTLYDPGIDPPGGTYINAVPGTSFAAPHVAGALALLLDAFPNLTVAEQESCLINTAMDLGAGGSDNTYGNGRIDVLVIHQSILSGGCNHIYLPLLMTGGL